MQIPHRKELEETEFKRKHPNLVGCQRLISIKKDSLEANLTRLTGCEASHRPAELPEPPGSAGRRVRPLVHVLFTSRARLELQDEELSGPAGVKKALLAGIWDPGV